MGENNDYLIIGEGLHKVKTLEKAQAADGGSYGPPCMQLFLMGIAACAIMWVIENRGLFYSE